MLREGGKGLSQDAVSGVRLEGGVGEAEQETLVPPSVWAPAAGHRFPDQFPLQSPAQRDSILMGGGGAAVGAAL